MRSEISVPPLLVWLGLPTALALGLYVPLLPGMAREWLEFPSLSHGFAIPAIAAYLVWVRAKTLENVAVEPSLWGLPVLLLGLAGLVVGVQGEEATLARISLPITLLGLAIFLAGPRITGRIWIGIAYLALMVPVPYSTLKLAMYRSRLTDAAASAYLLEWLGVPVQRDGVLLHLPDITLEVADDCSSIPALAALLSLGVAYAYLSERSPLARATLIAGTLPLAILSNIIRITTTAAAAYHVGSWTLGTVYHRFNGTVNFLVTFLLLVALDALVVRRLERRA